MGGQRLALYCTSCGSENSYTWDGEYGGGPPEPLVCRSCRERAVDWLELCAGLELLQTTVELCSRCALPRLPQARYCVRCGQGRGAADPDGRSNPVHAAILAELAGRRLPTLDGAASRGLARLFLEALRRPPGEAGDPVALADRFVAWCERACADASAHEA